MILVGTFVPPQVDALPASGALFAVYGLTTDNKIYYWTGSAWSVLGA